MRKRFLCGLLALLLVLAAGCSPAGEGSSLLEGGAIQLEGLRDEDGVYQLAELPIGTPKAVLEERFGDSLNFGGVSGTYETSGLLEKATYRDWDVQVSFELNNGLLELVYLYFRQPREGVSNPATAPEIFQTLRAELEELYGEPAQEQDNENSGLSATTVMWTAEAGGQPSMLMLNLAMRGDEPQNLALVVGLNQMETAQAGEE